MLSLPFSRKAAAELDTEQTLNSARKRLGAPAWASRIVSFSISLLHSYVLGTVTINSKQAVSLSLGRLWPIRETHKEPQTQTSGRQVQTPHRKAKLFVVILTPQRILPAQAVYLPGPTLSLNGRGQETIPRQAVAPLVGYNYLSFRFELFNCLKL